MTLEKNLILIGYRGTGKSTIAASLSQRLRMEVINLDSAIVARAGKSIPEIVETKGWEGFRDLESSALRAATLRTCVIIDCGGGIVLRQDNVDAIRRSGIVFLLEAAVGTIAGRIRGDSNRPTLTGKGLIEEIEEVLAVRQPLYEAAADHRIATDSASSEDLTDRIAEIFVRISGAAAH